MKDRGGNLPQAAEQPSCTVVIPTRDRPQELERCLQAVARLNYSKFDVVVVDSSPSTGESRQVAGRWGVRYILAPRPGCSRARNRGARASHAEIIGFVDDDAAPDPEWLCHIVREFGDPRVMAVTGRIVPYEPVTDQRRPYIDPCGYALGTERHVFDGESPDWFEKANFGGIGTLANVAVRRSAFNVWPGFDERIGVGMPLGGGAEPYAFFKLIDRGYRVVYAPQAVAYHPIPKTMHALRARHLRQLCINSGYATLLFCEQGRYRGQLMRYLAGWLRGQPRSWRVYTSNGTPRIAPRWRELLACLPGPFLYALAILKHTQSQRHADRKNS